MAFAGRRRRFRNGSLHFGRDDGNGRRAWECPPYRRRLRRLHRLETCATGNGRRVFGFAVCPPYRRRLGRLHRLETCATGNGRRVFGFAVCPPYRRRLGRLHRLETLRQRATEATGRTRRGKTRAAAGEGGLRRRQGGHMMDRGERSGSPRPHYGAAQCESQGFTLIELLSNATCLSRIITVWG